ncbi:flagellar assembly protein FliH [Tissierella praeacuta DSM 18095]|uniref:Flagellar assembly protein FliH n=1 Tax=Tissierella praeacuta DSM 18095 TaxID=1123404 RepID=A0A1M4SM07_9FIRM|nr:FliH/SctL family protein [Tissierella praeacuta]SHE33225.1 flagellar assembly protein FliH [Tissierella praeacuta DSM 18095]SUP01558.1 flagellar assembly protein H [Tissierella praeacuta]
MSNVIKSFRVIETEIIEPTNDLDDEKTYVDESIIESIIEEAKIKGQNEYEKIIEDAKKKSLKIIEDAEEQKETMIDMAYARTEEILEEAKKTGYNEGYELGYREGYETGYNEGKVKSDALINEAVEIKNGYIYKKESLLKELEEDIIELVISIYEKLINKKNEEDSELMISLVLNGINNLDLTDKLTIITSKEDFNILEMARNEILAKASMISELDIKYDISLEKGDCILETSKGNIDVSLKNQLAEVRELLTTILNNE